MSRESEESKLTWWQSAIVMGALVMLVLVLVLPGGGSFEKVIAAVAAVGPVILFLVPGDTLNRPLVIAAIGVFGLVAGVYLLGSRVYTVYRTYDVTANTALTADRELGPGESITMRVRVPSPRRYLTITFGWSESDPAVGGCDLDLGLTIFGIDGYPANPYHLSNTRKKAEIDLGSSRRTASLGVELTDRDPLCAGFLHVAHVTAHR
jgi:hypothetical protein